MPVERVALRLRLERILDDRGEHVRDAADVGREVVEVVGAVPVLRQRLGRVVDAVGDLDGAGLRRRCGPTSAVPRTSVRNARPGRSRSPSRCRRSRRPCGSTPRSSRAARRSAGSRCPCSGTRPRGRCPAFAGVNSAPTSAGAGAVTVKLPLAATRVDRGDTRRRQCVLRAGDDQHLGRRRGSGLRPSPTPSPAATRARLNRARPRPLLPNVSPPDLDVTEGNFCKLDAIAELGRRQIRVESLIYLILQVV